MDGTFTIDCVLPLEYNKTKWSGYYSPVWWDDRWRVGVTSKFQTAALYIDLLRRDASHEPVFADCIVSVKYNDKYLRDKCAFKKVFTSGRMEKICDIPIGSSNSDTKSLSIEAVQPPAGGSASQYQMFAKVLDEFTNSCRSSKKFVQITIQIAYGDDSLVIGGYVCSTSASLKDDIVSYTTSPAGLECADVELIGSDGSVHTHSFLLKSRSYIMMTLIEYHTIDGHESVRIKFPTIPKDVLEDLVCFIERDSVPNLPQNAMDLFILADQYYLRELKSVCEHYLANNVNAENATHLRSLCDTIGSPIISAALDRAKDDLVTPKIV